MRLADWTAGDVLDAIEAWADDNYGVPPGLIDWNPGLARHMGYVEAAARFERDGTWPHSRIVIARFGSWNDGIAAAGFVPMQPGDARSLGDQGTYWTHERLVDAVHRWVAQHGHAPRPRDWERIDDCSRGPYNRIERPEEERWPTMNTVNRAFGSISSLVKIAGHDPVRHPLEVLGYGTETWTREAVLGTIRAFAYEHGGRAPTLKDATRLSCRRAEQVLLRDPMATIAVLPSLTVACRWFGSWNRTISAAGLQPRSQCISARWGSGEDAYWTCERITNRVREWVDLHGRTPRRSDWTGNSDDRWPSATTVANRFGSFNAAIESAGFRGRSGRYESRWNRASILDAIREWAEVHGRPPRNDDWHSPSLLADQPNRLGTADQSWPSVTTVRREFGTWLAALEEAGVTARPVAWTKQTMIDAAREWFDRHGRRPRSSEWTNLGSLDLEVYGICSHGNPSHPWPGATRVIRSFGRWSALTEAAFGPGDETTGS